MTLNNLMGEGTELTSFQLGLRAFLVFIVLLIMLRIIGRRAFGMGAAFDNLISILLGAIMSRAVVGASPFIPTIVGTLVIIALYRFCAWLSIKSDKFGRIVKGETELLYEQGKMKKENMERCLVTEKDLLESVHHEANIDTIEQIDKAYLERDGSISVIKKIDN